MSLQKLISCEQSLFSGGGRWYKEYSLPLPSPHSPSPILFLHSRVTSSHTSQIIQRKKGNFTFSDYRLLTTGPSYSPRVSFIDATVSPLQELCSHGKRSRRSKKRWNARNLRIEKRPIINDCCYCKHLS